MPDLRQDYSEQVIADAIKAALDANRGWHSDVGPHDYIIPFLRSLNLSQLADAVERDEQEGWKLRA